jgi:hypothetical protein
MSRKFLYASVIISIVALILIAAKKTGTIGYYASPSGGPSWSTVIITGDFTVVQNLSLPAGDYIANAAAVVSVGGPEVIFSVDCIFTLNGARVGELSRGMVGGSFNNFLTLPLTVGFTITKPQELAVACRADPPGVYSQPSPITAIRVDNLVIQEGFVP